MACWSSLFWQQARSYQDGHTFEIVHPHGELVDTSDVTLRDQVANIMTEFHTQSYSPDNEPNSPCTMLAKTICPPPPHKKRTDTKCNYHLFSDTWYHDILNNVLLPDLMIN